jgi:uncharacterized membrane protein HdeD (DUF308 family)
VIVRPRIVRVLAGAVLGAGLVLGWWAFFMAFPDLPVHLVGDERCRNDLGCGLGAAYLSIVITVTLVVAASVVVGLLVLRAIRVRPGWPVAVLGPVLGWLVALLLGNAMHESLSLGLAMGAMAVGYGVAGMLPARRGA